MANCSPVLPRPTFSLGGVLLRILPSAALAATLIGFSIVLAGCGGGGSSSNSDVQRVLGTWDGTMTVTGNRSVKIGKGRGIGDTFGLALQFLQNAGGGVAGTLVKTLTTNIGGVSSTVVKEIGPFTGTLENSALNLLAHMPYDANGVPSTTTSTDLTAQLTVGNGTMNGTFQEGHDTGTVTVTQQTTSSTANVNVQGTWAGNSANQGGLTLIGQTQPVDFTLTIGAQDAANGLTQVTISSPGLGQPFTAMVGGVTGNAVNITGTLPNGTTAGGIDLSGKPYTFSAKVDAANPNKLTGELQVDLLGAGYMKAASFIAYRQQSGGGANPTIFVADATRVDAMDDITGKNFTTNILSGATPYSAYDLALGPNGHLYLADYPRQIEEFDASGHFVTAYQPSSPPSHVYVDAAGKIYWRGDDLTINRMDNMSGANRKSIGGLSSGMFSNPAGIATDTGGYVYVADAIKDQIMRFDPTMDPTTMKTFGSYGGGPGQFDMSDPTTYESPGHAIAIDQANKVYIADFNNGRIVRFDADALNNPANANVVTLPMETIRSTSGILARPLAVTVDKASSPHVFFTTEEAASRTTAVTGTFLIEASNFSLTGTTLQRLGGAQAPEGGQTGHFHYPLSVVVK